MRNPDLFAWPRQILLPLVLGLSLSLTGCDDDDDDDAPPTEQQTPLDPIALTIFDDDGVLEANIRRTTYGVPHITADNLESLAYGSGYAFAQDNICSLMDRAVYFNSERSRFFGPDQLLGSGDNLNVISDFGFKALKLREQAESNIGNLSDRTRALLMGYTSGLNRYLAEQDPGMDPRCANMPWMRPLNETDYLTLLLGTALEAGTNNFLDAMFFASPDDNFLPIPVANATSPSEKTLLASLQRLTPSDLNAKLSQRSATASNGWAIGSDLSENGMGMLLANPHLSMTGNLRFWQSHITIPGELNAAGASLVGMPGPINIGFTEQTAWTHTTSTSRHFYLYQHFLPGDGTATEHLFDGAREPFTKETFTIDVNVGGGAFITLQKDYWFSRFGPMVEAPGQLPWGADPTLGGWEVAYAIKDANALRLDIVDHWLAMNLSRNIDELAQSHDDFSGLIFNNTIAVDKAGTAFYVDDSPVAGLSEEAEAAIATHPFIQGFLDQAGIFVFPGTNSRFDFSAPMEYARVPKLMRQDFVQNSNDSYWLSNPDAPMDFSLLYGPKDNQQSWRSRMGQKMLRDGMGNDGLFSMDDLEQALLGSRNYLGEAVHGDLLAHCQARGAEPVDLAGDLVDLSAGCAALAQWDGQFELESSGAHLFREFADQFNNDPQWAVPFNPQDPTNTPHTLVANNRVLEQFAAAIRTVEAAGVALDAPFGEVQFIEFSAPDGSPSGLRMPWAGTKNTEGGFNVFRDNRGNDGTLLPRHSYARLPGSTLSTEAGGYHIAGGSGWMFVLSFTEEGPSARGILLNSQTENVLRPYYLDQTALYSSMPQLRPILFTEDEINANLISEITIRSDQ